MKLVKKVLPVLAAAALVVTTVPTVTVQAAPNAIATYDFENGTSGMSDSGLGGPAPAVTQDGERGNVLQFNGGTGSTCTAGVPTKNSTTIDPGTPSSMKLDTNPFAGKSLTGATISMWVKAPAAAAEEGAGLIGFVSKEYSGLEHPDKIYDKNTTDELISGQYCYGIGVGANDDDVLMSSAMVNFVGMLSNSMWMKDLDQTFITNADKWVFMVVTLGNNAADNKIYIDGTKIAETLPQTGVPCGIGKRFNLGEAHTTDAEANKHEPQLMDILTASDTTAYFGYTGCMAAANGVFVDDVTFYDSIASDSDVVTMTQNAKNSAPGGGNNENPSGADNSNDNNAADGGNQTNNTNTSNNNATSTRSPAASAKAATNNQNLPQTGVVSTGVLVACGAAVVAGGAMLFKKREKEEE